MKICRSVVISSLVACSACVNGASTTDGGALIDSGTAFDAGTPFDAGTFDAGTFDAGTFDAGLDVAKSILITSRVGFTQVADPAAKLTLGRLLADRHVLMNAKRVASGKATIAEREGALMVFTKMAEDVIEHNALPDARKIGLVKNIKNPFRDLVLANWDFGGSGPDLPPGQKDGPFRLLAVINRLDVAGANDNPGGGDSLPEEKRKFFGEGRLVFGLVATGPGGEPYPMTLIMEYHLPYVTKTVDGSGNVTLTGVQSEFNYDSVSQSDWIDQRQIWATAWLELSRYSFDSVEYQSKLKTLVTLFARAENSIALRVGYIVEPVDTNDTTQEFEYRENYTQGGFLLAPRDLARDVHPCVIDQPFFADLVNQRWQATTHDMNYSYKWPAAIAEQNAIKAACGVPMGAKDGEQGPRVHVARFTREKWWPALFGTSPTDADLNNMEEKRHDFAMTSCSGCHSKETGTPGFMIFPRADNQDSAVSPFLRGTVTATLPNGRQYTYNELQRRSDLLLAFSKRKYPGSCGDGMCLAPPSAPSTMEEEMLMK